MFEEYLNRSSYTGFADPVPVEQGVSCGDAESSACGPRTGRRRRRHIPLPLLLALCMAVSGVFGFVGGSLSGQATRAFAANDAEMLYGSFIRTAAAGVAPANTAPAISEVATTVKQTVVEITTETVTRSGRMGQFVSAGAGSGVVVSTDGLIATNYHVVSGARSVTVRLADGREYAAEIKGVDAKTDLAVLKIGATGLMPAVLGDSSAIAVGDAAIAVGNPLGELGGTVTSGIISALDREIAIDGEMMSLMQTDAAINPGNSGGGLFNRYGELIGIVNAKSSGMDIEGLGFAIPINAAKAVIGDLTEYGYVKGRVGTGLTLVDIQSAQLAMLYRVNQLGLYISESPVAQLRSGDRITAVNGATVADLASFNAALTGLSVGDTVKITVVRNGKNVTADIVLIESVS